MKERKKKTPSKARPKLSNKVSDDVPKKTKWSLMIDSLDTYPLNLTNEELKKVNKVSKVAINLKEDWERLFKSVDVIGKDFLNSLDIHPLSSDWFAIDDKIFKGLVSLYKDKGIQSSNPYAVVRRKGGRIWIYRNKQFLIPLSFEEDDLGGPKSDKVKPGMLFSINAGLEAKAILERFNFTIGEPYISYSRPNSSGIPLGKLGIEGTKVTEFYVTDWRNPKHFAWGDYKLMGNLCVIDHPKKSGGPDYLYPFEDPAWDYPLRSYKEFRDCGEELVMASLELENKRIEEERWRLRKGDLIRLKLPDRGMFYKTGAHVGHAMDPSFGTINTFLDKISEYENEPEGNDQSDRLLLYLGTVEATTRWGFKLKVQKWLKGEKIHFCNLTPLVYDIVSQGGGLGPPKK